MKINNKAQVSTDTPILITIFAFQAFIIIMLGFINIKPTTTTADTSLFDFGNIIVAIKELGVWNSVIFLPLEIGIIYIIAKLVRGGG